MNNEEYKDLWQEFRAISAIPRCTGAETAVLNYIEDSARSRGYEVRTDATGNIVVYLPASAGYTSVPGLIIQAHVDMVCEKVMGHEHNFDSDGLRLVVQGDVLSAAGTTLGADNGIAVAIMLAIIKRSHANRMKHGALELLFTVDEEGGLIGALKLDPKILNFQRMINLDSEEEGIFYIGCAGGLETEGTIPLEWEVAPAGLENRRLSICGLGGGHSGAEIHREPGNSIVLTRRLLAQLAPEALVYNIAGGDRHNVVPREALVDFLISKEKLAKVTETLEQYAGIFTEEFAGSEAALSITTEELSAEYPQKVLTGAARERLVQLLSSIPQGILQRNRVLGLVSTSTNLAAVYIRNGDLRILTSQRSDSHTLLHAAADLTAMPIRLAGGRAKFLREYAGWQPQPDSELLKSATELWQRRTGTKPQVSSIHAGLECGVIGAKLAEKNGLVPDMLSFGPDIHGAHTPDERTSISSCERVFDFLLALFAEAK